MFSLRNASSAEHPPKVASGAPVEFAERSRSCTTAIIIRDGTVRAGTVRAGTVRDEVLGLKIMRHTLVSSADNCTLGLTPDTLVVRPSNEDSI
ncbi:hypothetical protein EH165_05295 [Nakamurella antarctica]|uniref:Uncharacterized protein n=1 Tax=Nakamurella antarctica TaxID=1902245 RepID=A0A3G8ZT41_9ACTN|nr:hypothetical protein [Nakamurella antarctica]AZI57654.1 hypothetical protein EH165_05295 [Nakamurella antarctica]